MAKELKKNKAQMVMPESKEDKKKALESAIAHILKTYAYQVLVACRHCSHIAKLPLLLHPY